MLGREAEVPSVVLTLGHRDPGEGYDFQCLQANLSYL